MGLGSRLKSAPFSRAPLASSTGHDLLHALAGCCPSPVIGKAVFARFVGGATSNGLHAEAIVHMLVRSDTLVFSGSQMWHPFISNKGREFVWRAESEGFRSSRIGLVAEVQLEELIASVRPMSAKDCEQIVSDSL